MKQVAGTSLRTRIITVLLVLLQVRLISAQDYEVTEIQCTFSNSNNVNSISSRDSIIAKLRKPDGFKGNPLFADDRAVDPELDQTCQIRPDGADPSGLKYNLKITDFNRCGVLKRNGFVHVRVWFPQFPGVVMQSDQELIIMCKPPEPTVIENKAAGFAGSFPHGARVSGVVEETPGRLEYEVALYKEAPAARINNVTSSELPVDQAVPIGTKLQLRARISPESAWKYVKLMEVTVSPDPDDPHMSGSVALVKDGHYDNVQYRYKNENYKKKAVARLNTGKPTVIGGCEKNRPYLPCIGHRPNCKGVVMHKMQTRDYQPASPQLKVSVMESSLLLPLQRIVVDECRNRDFASIIPHQPARYRERHNEVFLDFEAFLLSTMKERSTLWIHSQIKACMDAADCQPDFCLDLFEPSGHGRRRRSAEEIEIVETDTSTALLHNYNNNSTQYTKIKENLEYTVLMPGEFYHRNASMESSCSTFLVIAAILGCLLFLSAFIMCWLASRLHSALVGAATTSKNIDQLVRETRHYKDTGYTGRATTQ